MLNSHGHFVEDHFKAFYIYVFICSQAYQTLLGVKQPLLRVLRTPPGTAGITDL